MNSIVYANESEHNRGLSQTSRIMDMDNYKWDILPDTVRIQYLCGRSTENVRIVLQYEYCRKLLSSTSGKTLYFTVILPRVREK